MKTLIIYKSVHHGNTKEIAEAIAQKMNADVKALEEVESQEVCDYDLLGFGSGIYFRNFHKELLKFIDKIDEKNRKKAFIFSTSGIPKIPALHNFEKKIRGKLKRKNFKIIGSFRCRGFDDVGPLSWIGGIHKNRPNEKEVEKARKFAGKIRKRCKND